MSAGKVFRKGSVDKYIRRASASKKMRLSQPMPPRKLNLSDSLLDSSGEEFRLNLSCDEDEPASPGLVTFCEIFYFPTIIVYNILSTDRTIFPHIKNHFSL